VNRVNVDRVGAWLPGLLALVFLAFFAVFVVWIYVTDLDRGQQQRNIRAALTARGRVIRAQLDEETGLRGYTSTLDKSYLQPYVQGERAFPSALDNERTCLRLVYGSGRLDPIVDDQANLHSRWQKDVAGPLLADPVRKDQLERQAEGKTLIDRFRYDNDEIADELFAQSTIVDDGLSSALQRILGMGLLGTVCLLALGVFGVQYAERMQRRIRAERTRYENEKRTADRLQFAILQRDLPEFPRIELDADYRPAEEGLNVGGDWYSAFALKDGRLFFSIGDVCGHGVDAAVVMGRSRQNLLSAALQGNDPAAILSLANESLRLQGDTMVTAICGFADTNAMEIRYATAGHPPPVFWEPEAGARFLPHEGLPLGILDGMRYRTFVQPAAVGCLLIAYTDGVVERNRDIRAGERALIAAVADVAMLPYPTAKRLGEKLLVDYVSDDAAILSLRFVGPAGERSRPV
jgi:serine phosphatase RsbU (regulator of sigma subunit)